MEIDLPQITDTDRDIFVAAPVFFRLRETGYLDPEDLFTDEDLAFCREHGVTPHPAERR